MGIRFFTTNLVKQNMFKNSALKKSYMVATAVVMIMVLLTTVFRTMLDAKLNIPSVILSEGWMTEVSGSEVELLEYPTRISAEPYQEFTIYKTIDASDDIKALLVFTDHQDIVVRLDADIIYSATQQPFSYSFYANLHHVISVDHDINSDQILSITFHSPYQKSSGLISPIYESSDSTGSLYLHIVFQHILSFGFGMLFIVMGIVVLAISQVVDQQRKRGRFYLAYFAIIFGLWVIARSTLLQFITSNAYILGGLQFTLFLLIPIPIIMYYKSNITKRFEKESLALVAYFGFQAIVITTLQLFGVIDFMRPTLFVSVMELLGMANILVFIVIDVLNHNELAKKFSRYYGILFLYGFITFINEQTFSHDDLAIYSLAVLALLAIVVFIDYILFIETRLKLSYLSEDYAKLAYMDRLTGSKNRHAYEEDFERFFSNELAKKNLRLVFFDFDGLKQINDQYGHVEGDFALKEGFSRILDAFGRYGECYRIGGDEFACIIQSLDDDLYLSCRQRLISDVKSISSYHKFDLRISLGTSIYSEDDENINDMIVRADKDMYQNKNKHKNA